MDSDRRAEVERQVRAHCDGADYTSATNLAVKSYGPEIFGLLLALHGNEQEASDVFSVFCERLWRGLEGFAWQCSMRTWAYTIARNASYSHRDEARRRARIHPQLPADSQLSAIAEQVRSATLTCLKTESRQRIARLRETLSPDEQLLLTLRVDKELPWSDLVHVLHDGEDALTDEVIKREAARLRKRFQLVKDKLVKLGRREGLLEQS